MYIYIYIIWTQLYYLLVDKKLLISHIDLKNKSENITLNDFPCGFIAFNSNFEFSQACAFCSDFSLDYSVLIVK